MTLFAALLLIAPALADHYGPPDGDPWADPVYDEEGNLIYCNAQAVVPLGADYFIHDRPGPGSPYGTGLVSEGGGGTWVYQESNGIPGIQLGGELDFRYAHCPNPDRMIV